MTQPHLDLVPAQFVLDGALTGLQSSMPRVHAGRTQRSGRSLPRIRSGQDNPVNAVDGTV